MFVTDKQGAQWQVDEGIRERAGQLIQKFDELVGYIDLDQVIFLRLQGSKANWHGKCFYIGKAPMNVIPKYVMFKLQNLGFLDLSGIRNLDTGGFDIFDIRFIIVLNDDSISQAEGDIQRVEDLTLLHEMMHIHPDGDKLVRHDLEDFALLVDKFGPYWTQGIFSDRDKFDGVVDEEALGEVVEKALSNAIAATEGFTPPPPPTLPKSGTSETWNPEESE